MVWGCRSRNRKSWGERCPFETLAQRQGYVDQCDEHRHFDQWSDDGGQGLPGGGAVGGDRYRDGEFEVVAGGGERQGGGAFIAQAQRSTGQVAAAPHDGEVGQ